MNIILDWLRDTVLGNLIAVALAQVLQPIYRNFIPWSLRKIRYSGYDISGNWTSEFSEDGINGQEEISIKQSGNKIKGKINSSITDNKARTYDLSSKIVGFMKEDSLIGYYIPVKKRNMGAGSYIMQLKDDGDTLLGKSVYKYSRTGSIKLLNKYVWKRKL